ncbi:hypothetical protein BGZ98_008004 [Dissophora globulifera]|nr:hypothetical protein BGZ98_008004 [Dissophora globulifera]
MSASRRKQAPRSTVAAQSSAASILSGAEMLVLQQNIKQYIIARQTRPLTAHELDEFEKIKGQLLPNLLRYSKLSAQSLTGDFTAPTAAAASATVSNSQNNNSHVVASGRPNASQGSRARAASGSYNVLSPKPAGSQLESRISSTSVTRKSTAVVAKPKAITIKQEPSQESAVVNIPHAAPPTGGRGVVATPSKKTTKKRPKMEVFQDVENVQQKRRRIRRKADNGDESDKENIDPNGVAVPKSKKKVLGDATNFVGKNSNTATVKGKNVVREPVDQKSAVQQSHPTLNKPTLISIQQQQQQQQVRQPKQRKQLTLPQSVTTSTPTTAIETTDKRKRGSIPLPPEVPCNSEDLVAKHVQDYTRQDPLDDDQATQPTSRSVIQTETSDAVDDTAAEQHEQLSRTTRMVTNSAGEVIEILPSVDDDESTNSFAAFIKMERGTPIVSAAPGRTDNVRDEILEIPGSQDSDELYMYSLPGSQEMTFPMHNFLYPDLKNEPQDYEPTLPAPEFLLHDLPEDPHEAADVLERALDRQAEIDSLQWPSRDTGSLESTDFADGVWCIDDHWSQFESIACGYTEHWIALETPSQVQFWWLDDRGNLSKSKWCRGVQVNKVSSHPLQIVFAPNDSFAIVLSPKERTVLKVPLVIGEREQLILQLTLTTWSGLTPSSAVRSIIVEREAVLDEAKAQSKTKFQVVFGADEAGCIGTIPIPDDDAVSETAVVVEKLCYSETKKAASSVAKVSNTSSLILASFGTALVLWDLDNNSKPVSAQEASHLVPRDISPFIEPPSPESCPTTLGILSATVPAQFFAAYQDILDTEDISPSEWPILAVLRMCDPSAVDSGEEFERDQCGLYAIRGDAIELVHEYQVTKSISSVSSSSRFIACMTKASIGCELYFWDVLRPEAVVRLSLLDAPPPQQQQQQQNQDQKRENMYEREQERYTGSHGEISITTAQAYAQKHNNEREEFDTLSIGSTLSSPPKDISSLSCPSFEETTAVIENLDVAEHSHQEFAHSLEHIRRQSAERAGSGRQQRQPKEWIDLTSVSWMERKRMQFSAQVGQRWAVVLQRDTLNQNASVVHIMDLTTLLPH